MLLTLLIPELLWPEPEDRDTQDALPCPTLETLLARGARTRQAAQSYEATLCDTCGLPPDAPYAALRRLGENDTMLGTPSKSGWLNADPVHLRFLQERLVLADPEQLAITTAEAQALIAAFNRHLSDYGRFHLGAAGRWYLEVGDPALASEHRAAPLSAVAGRSIERLLPPAGEARTQRRLLNEAQMLLHTHPVNQEREASGRMTINSLWLWGAGQLSNAPRTDDASTILDLPFDSLWSADPLACGLGRAAGIPVRPPATDANDLFAHTPPDGHPLLVLDDLLAAVQYESGENYRNVLAHLEHHWFAPLQAALARGRLQQLTLVAPTAYGALSWKIDRLALCKLWRRPQALGALARELAQHDNERTTP